MYYEDPGSDAKDVFLYIRQSTDEKSGKQVRSMGDQRSDCEKMAAFLGLNIVDIFEEDRSAKIPNNRPVFSRMIKELSCKSPERRRADGVLSWHPDRLSRNALESGRILQMLDDEFIKNLYFPVYAFHNDPSGKEHLVIEFARAKGHSDRLSVAVSRGSTNRELEGAYVHGRDKVGYVKRRDNPENPKLCSLFPEPCPQDFPILKRAFAMRLAGEPITRIVAILSNEGHTFKNAKISDATLHRCLTDPFYYGKWVINADLKTERIVDLRLITLQDGTKFQPVVTEAEFMKCQLSYGGNQKIVVRTRHTNPIAGRIICSRCQATLRPARRKIHTANGKIKQLGYECQSKDDTGKNCVQCRVRFEILFDYIAMSLAHVSLEKRDYHRFLIGMEAFLAKKKKAIQATQKKLRKRLSDLDQEKKQLLHRKAILAETGDLQNDDRRYYADEIKRLNQAINSTRVQLECHDGSIDEKITSFKKFIERCQNLPVDWENADDLCKREISKKVLLNLVVKDREIQSVIWKEPYAEWLNGSKINTGGPSLISIEPSLCR